MSFPKQERLLKAFAGKTYIIVKAASGVSTIVAIKVNKKSSSGTVNVTLNALFANGLTE